MARPEKDGFAMPIAPELIPKTKMVAPGTVLRRALDDITMAEFGALVVFLDDTKAQENILQGGFYIGTGFSPEKLYELAKMDGAIILDESVTQILAANVQLAPDPALPTNETGMRHRAAERTARQTRKFVLTISRRRKVITLYYKNYKHQLKEINTLIIETGSEGRLLVLRLNSVREDVDALAQLLVKDYGFSSFSDDEVAQVIEKEPARLSRGFSTCAIESSIDSDQ
jgi:DNA integrity scanning protein DisA with diadenylate cyclase activity